MPAPRAPLGEISGNRPKNIELTPVQRGFIEGAIQFGASFSKVAESLNCSKGTISNTLRLASERHNGESKPRPGRPQKWDDRLEKRILRIIRLFPKWTYRQIREIIDTTFSKKTIYRILKKKGLTNQIAKKRPFLSFEAAQKRLDWALLYKDWSAEKWGIIIWSDKCSVERNTGARRTWVWRTPGQKWLKEYIDTYTKGKDISIIIWGTIWIGGRSDVVIMERDKNSKKKGYSTNSYIAVLKNQLPIIYNPGMKFMQDNAPIYTAGKVKKQLGENGIEVINQPPYSPDLNPIEIIWAWIKEWIYEHYPDLHEMGETEEAYQRLYQATNEAWEAIPQEKIDSLIRTMDNRINAVLQAKGWHTRY